MFKNKFSLKNRKAIILGGNGLIGKEIVKAFTELGAESLVLDIIKKEKALKEEPIFDNNKINYEEFDLTKNEIIYDLMNKYGVPDIFVSAAYPRTKDWPKNNFKEIKYESFKKNLDFQLTSNCWLSKIIADKMVDNDKAGKIILLNSIYGIVAQDKNIYENTNLKENMTYSIVKGGITNFTRQLASFYGQYGIKVNSICAGGVRSPISGVSKEQDKVFIDNYSQRVLLGRMGEPEDIASAVAFLASDASDYITGINLPVDGGWTAI